MESNSEKSNISKTIAELEKKKLALQNEIGDYQNKILKLVEGEPDIKSQLTQHLGNVTSLLETLNKYSEEISDVFETYYTTRNGKPSKVEEINSFYKEIVTNEYKVDSILEKLKNYEIEFLGNDKPETNSQKKRLIEHENKLLATQKDWEEKYTTLYNKIEGLLPGASATGLAKAYQDQRKSFETPYWIWAITFVATMFGIIAFSIWHLKDATGIEDVILRVISRLPIFIPAFWLAIFASKQQSQNKRLQQEYAHKESLAISYEADRREIEKLKDDKTKEDLSKKLLDTIIEMAKYNPSETIGNKIHTERPPSILDLFKLKTYKKLMSETPK